MSPIPLPSSSDTWPGRDFPFATAEEKAALGAGRHFLILAGQANFGGTPAPGEKPQIALLVRFCTDDQLPIGSPFVFTRSSSPSRLKLVDLVNEALALGDVAGPCRIRLIEQDDPTRKAFWFIEAVPAAEPVPATVQADEPGDIDPDSIPW